MTTAGAGVTIWQYKRYYAAVECDPCRARRVRMRARHTRVFKWSSRHKARAAALYKTAVEGNQSRARRAKC